MSLLTATELSAQLGVTKARVSQYVAEGKLDGCFEGEGRRRRFDLAKAAEALGKRLDRGQLLTNGAQTRLALGRIAAGAEEDEGQGEAPARRQKTDGRLPSGDSDEYTLTQLAIRQEELRRKRRENALDEGLFVLAAEAERVTARAMAQEIAGFETVLRDGARAVADRLGVDFKAARQILIETWRAHRTVRSGDIDAEAEATGLSAAEKAEDI